MRTSINLQICDIPKINTACEITKMGYSQLICHCLMKYFASHPHRLLKSRIESLVEYQPKGFGYHIVNICFSPSVYNLAVNFRVFSRISVSMLVTISISEYLDEVVEEYLNAGKVVHNYVLYKHNLIKNIYTNKLLWVVDWEIEEKPGAVNKKKNKNRTRRKVRQTLRKKKN